MKTVICADNIDKNKVTHVDIEMYNDVCNELKESKKMIKKLRREIDYLVLCRSGDIEYTRGGKSLMKEFDSKYRWL